MFTIYSFVGSLFNPQFDQADHAEALHNMTVSNQELAWILLMEGAIVDEQVPMSSYIRKIS